MKKLLITLALMLVMILAVSPAGWADEYYTVNNEWEYTLVHRVSISNDSAQDAADITVEVPLLQRDLTNYSLSGEEQLNPAPHEIITDESGKRVAVYHFDTLKGGEVVYLEQRYALTVRDISFGFDVSAVSPDYLQADIAAAYFESGIGVESDNPQVVAFAESLAEYETNPYLIAKSVFSAVNLYLDYQDVAGEQHGAAAALQRGHGVCEDYASLMVAALRARGVPARMISGYLYVPKAADGSIVSLDDTSHVWVEFYLSGIGWVIADPTFSYSFNIGGKEQKFIDWNYFTKTSGVRRYIAFNEYAEEVGQVKYTATGGKLQLQFHADLEFGASFTAFTDVADHWAREHVEFLAQLGYADGIGNGLYGVNDPLTRAQMAVFLQRVLELPDAEAAFADVPAEHWAAGAIGALAAEGSLAGYPDGSFAPGKSITRAETAALLARALQLVPQDTAERASYTDVPAGHWAETYIEALSSLGLLEGRGDGSFDPNATLTRGEAAKILALYLQNSTEA
ncbi:MAG: S-layer homology domain-containing protein [Firmicutes bacterium]|nr:S-layer homology domain-containing protein [Bacillota bacterium]